MRPGNGARPTTPDQEMLHVNVLIATGTIIVFALGILCYPLAFNAETESMSLMLFIAGVLLNCFAFFIPWQVTGHSRK